MGAHEILNYGGGTQTVALCVLVATGRISAPDYIIAADTGREMPTTWQYARDYMMPLLARASLPLHIAPHTLSTVDLYGKNGDLLVPVYTKTGKFPTYCSTEWKARVVHRYARQVLGIEGPIMNWIGFSLEERKRVKTTDGRRYPLLDLMLTRSDCERIILDAGLPLPSKSRCWMCPNQTNREWREVQSDPDLWSAAVAVDETLRNDDEQGGVWLHRSRVPLADAQIDDESAPEMGRQCGLGLCFV